MTSRAFLRAARASLASVSSGAGSPRNLTDLKRIIIFVFERNVYILIFDVTLKSACENYSIAIVLKMSISRKSFKKPIMILKK